ncbi:hypothetical protein PRIC2_001953 [Phytophthora ramorum]
MTNQRTTLIVHAAFVIALAVAPTPGSAFSFSTLFDGDNGSSAKDSSSSTEAQTGSDADLSDGTDIKPRQPILDAEKWFLTEEEITESRGGIPRDDMSVYTTGNKVTSYTAANEFYDAVYEDLSATEEGDRVLLAAWLTALVPLKPDVDPTGAETGVKEVFAGVVERGGHVNILNWANIGLDAMTFVEAADQLPIAVADESTILANNDIQHHAYFFAITNAMRKVSDPQDTCTYSGSSSTGKTM